MWLTFHVESKEGGLLPLPLKTCSLSTAQITECGHGVRFPCNMSFRQPAVSEPNTVFCMVTSRYILKRAVPAGYEAQPVCERCPEGLACATSYALCLFAYNNQKTFRDKECRTMPCVCKMCAAQVS